MNKSDLIDAIAHDAGITKEQAKAALESFTGNVTSALKTGSRVALVGFGSFSISRRAERAGRNPRTGRKIMISARQTVRFKAGVILGSTLNLESGGSDDPGPGGKEL